MPPAFNLSQNQTLQLRFIVRDAGLHQRPGFIQPGLTWYPFHPCHRADEAGRPYAPKEAHDLPPAVCTLDGSNILSVA